MFLGYYYLRLFGSSFCLLLLLMLALWLQFQFFSFFKNFNLIFGFALINIDQIHILIHGLRFSHVKFVLKFAF